MWCCDLLDQRMTSTSHTPSLISLCLPDPFAGLVLIFCGRGSSSGFFSFFLGSLSRTCELRHLMLAEEEAAVLLRCSGRLLRRR